jgi:hypothetical protein
MRRISQSSRHSFGGFWRSGRCRPRPGGACGCKCVASCRRAPVFFTIKFQSFLVQDGVEKLMMVFWEISDRVHLTAPLVFLQYPTPCLPRTSISRMVCFVASSFTILTSRYSSRADSRFSGGGEASLFPGASCSARVACRVLPSPPGDGGCGIPVPCRV